MLKNLKLVRTEKVSENIDLNFIAFESNELIDDIIKDFCDKNPEFQKKNGLPNNSTAVRALIIRGAKKEGIWK